jgi:LuxR family maltose regulon positive regulatory protein
LLLLASALQLAAPERITRLFLDEGQPLCKLLTRYLTTRAIDAQLHASTVAYAHYLLEQYPAPTHIPDAARFLLEPLSAREQQILHLLATGKSNEEIAATLFLTLSTVKWHLAHLYRKLGVHTRVQALAQARQLKLLER